MKFVWIAGAAALCVGTLGACETTPPAISMSERAITLPYDPNDYNPAELDAQAQRHCAGFERNAVFNGVTTEGRTVMWRYRHYLCV